MPFFSYIFPNKRFCFPVYFAKTFLSFSPLYLTPNAIFLHCILPRMHFFVCILPKPLRFLHCILPQTVIFGHCILPRMHFFGMYFAETPTLSLLHFRIKCNFWPWYFASECLFLSVFCRNPYSSLNCRLPQTPFFLIFFQKKSFPVYFA